MFKFTIYRLWLESAVKIYFLIISVMLGISLMFTIVGLVSFDLSVKQIKELLGSRNEGFAFNMIQGLG